MKTVQFIILLLAAAVIALVVTKPTDQECINRIRYNPELTGIDAVISGLAYTHHTVDIEDHIFYKAVYSRLDGERLGIGIFGTVITSSK